MKQWRLGQIGFWCLTPLYALLFMLLLPCAGLSHLMHWLDAALAERYLF